jgi:hypothetical protein
MPETHDPIAYTYEADYHCPACTEERFGRGPDGRWIAEGCEDNEDNPVGVVAPWDEWVQGTDECETLACGTCGEVINTAHMDPHSEDCPDYEAPDFWQLIESAPKGCQDVADLFHWSTNYDAGKGPSTLFLDLIGWSEDELGETMFDLKSASLGYIELSKLADALKEYSDAPHDVRAFVETLIASEGR